MVPTGAICTDVHYPSLRSGLIRSIHVGVSGKASAEHDLKLLFVVPIIVILISTASRYNFFMETTLNEKNVTLLGS